MWWTPWKVNSWKTVKEMEEQSQKGFVKNWLQYPCLARSSCFICDDSFWFCNKREEGEISHYVTATVNAKVLRWYSGQTLCALNPVTSFWKRTWTCSRSWRWRKTSAGTFAPGGHAITLRYVLLCWDWHSWFLFGTYLSWNFGRELVFPDSILF